MKYNDYELVFLAQENDEFATNILYKKYMDIISSKARRVYNYYLDKKGLDLEDVLQEAMIGFDTAIKKFNQNSDAIFFTFANLCIDRQLKTLVTKYSRDKHKFLNDAISLDFYDNKNLYDFVSDGFTPENRMLEIENVDFLYNKIKVLLTDIEDVIFDLKIMGLSYNEISSFLETDIKDVYNALGRIRIKVNRILNK